MAQAWQIAVNQAIAEYIKEVLDTTIYRRLWMAMLTQRGRLRTGVNGSYEQQFPIDFKEAPVTTLAYNEDIDYAPQDYLKWGTQVWKALKASDIMHIREYTEIAGSPNTIVDRYKRIVPKLISGVKNRIGLQIYNNSNTSGKEEDFDGLDTACGAGTVAVTDIIAQPDGAYLGIDTDLGGSSGNWSTDFSTYPNSTVATDWPEGSGDAHYAFRAPKLVNYTSNAWGTDAVTWESNCQRALSRTALWLNNTGGEGDGASFMAMLSTDLMAGFKNSLRASNRILTPHREAEQLGFGDVLNFEGVGVYSEYGCPARTGYVVDMDDLQMMFITPDMVQTKGPFETSEGSYKWYVFSEGNFRFDPRRLAKLFPYAAA